MKRQSVRVEITRVSNGVIVTPSTSYYDKSPAPTLAELDSMLVFDSREAFIAWAEEYFPDAD